MRNIEEEDFCQCVNIKGVYTKQGAISYQYYCTSCDKPIEGEEYYDDDPSDIY